MLIQFKLTSFLLFGSISPFFGFHPQGGFSLKIETPLFQNTQSIGVNWSVGDYAVYNIFKEEDQKEKVGQHRIEISGIQEIDGSQFYQITTTMLEGEQRTELTFLIPHDSKNLNLSKARNLKVATGFGSYSLKYATVRPGETLAEEGSETLRQEDKEIQVTRYSARYTDQKPNSTLWINPKIGPYGLVKGQIYIEDKYFYYDLAEYQSK